MRKFYTCMALLCACITYSYGQSISLTGSAYTQDFNTLGNTAGTTTNNLALTGWAINETGGGARDNEQYAVDNGASTTGDTYSYGSPASTDRALCGLRTGTLVPSYGANFTNNTGATIISLIVSFTGEEWRFGTLGRADQLNFEYSLDATSLTTGSWTNVSALNFTSPSTSATGAKDGNAAGNFTALSATISSLSIANGASFWIRWVDIDVTGADDGIGIDDFSLSTVTGALPVNGLAFSALKNGQQSILNWSTQQEVNSDRFIVERSSNGVQWNSIASLPAAGNSTTVQSYTYSDLHPLPGNNLYRLQLLDKDHSKSYSDCRRVNFNADFTYTLYPNPARDAIVITSDRVNPAGVQLKIVNTAGQVLAQQSIESGATHVDVTGLPTGLYYAHVLSTGGRITVLPFVKK